jgi:hypothetical protein
MGYKVKFMYGEIELISFDRLTLSLALSSAYFHRQYINATIKIYRHGELICVIQDESRW